MKTFGKRSFSSLLRIGIDLMLVTEIMTLLFRGLGFVSQFNLIYGHGPIHNESPAVKYAFYTEISVLFFGIFAILITLQLRKLINAFKKELFFESINVNRIKIISTLFLFYVIFDFIFTLFKQYLTVYFFDTMGKEALSHIYTFNSMVHAINFELLLAAVVIYIIACVFQVGHDLKEETTLTI